MRSERGNVAAKYDHIPAISPKSLRRQIGKSYDDKKIGNKYFGVSVGELLNDTAKARSKPGPASQIEQLAARAARLSRAEQKVVIKMLEGVLAKAG